MLLVCELLVHACGGFYRSPTLTPPQVSFDARGGRGLLHP